MVVSDFVCHQVDWGDENICSSGGGGEDGKLRLSNIYADHIVFQVVIITCMGLVTIYFGVHLKNISWNQDFLSERRKTLQYGVGGRQAAK